MHVEGFQRRSRRSSTSTPAPRALLKEKDENLLGEDIREGLTAIISVKLRDPQFEGQTKAKLGNVPMRSFVRRPPTSSSPSGSRRTRPRPTRSSRRRSAAAQARAAAKNARNAIRRKTALSGAGMPDKLKDCSSRNRRGASCSSSRATRPAAPAVDAAIRAPRRSCRSAARSSTSSGPASTRC